MAQSCSSQADILLEVQELHRLGIPWNPLEMYPLCPMWLCKYPAAAGGFQGCNVLLSAKDTVHLLAFLSFQPVSSYLQLSSFPILLSNLFQFSLLQRSSTFCNNSKNHLLHFGCYIRTFTLFLTDTCAENT